MSEPFKPGDLIRRRDNHNVTATIGQLSEDGQRWRTESGAWLDVMFWELVEPSVPVSTIRGICLDRLEKFPEWIANNSQLAAQILANNEAIRDLFKELTGEPLRNETP